MHNIKDITKIFYWDKNFPIFLGKHLLNTITFEVDALHFYTGRAQTA